MLRLRWSETEYGCTYAATEVGLLEVAWTRDPTGSGFRPRVLGVYGKLYGTVIEGQAAAEGMLLEMVERTRARLVEVSDGR